MRERDLALPRESVCRERFTEPSSDLFRGRVVDIYVDETVLVHPPAEANIAAVVDAPALARGPPVAVTDRQAPREVSAPEARTICGVDNEIRLRPLLVDVAAWPPPPPHAEATAATASSVGTRVSVVRLCISALFQRTTRAFKRHFPKHWPKRVSSASTWASSSSSRVSEEGPRQAPPQVAAEAPRCCRLRVSAMESRETGVLDDLLNARLARLSAERESDLLRE